MLPINNKMLSATSIGCLLIGIISTTNVTAKENADYSSLFTEQKTACLSLKEMTKATDLLFLKGRVIVAKHVYIK